MKKRRRLGPPSGRKQTHADDRRQARDMVLRDFQREALRKRTTERDWRGHVGDAYRREIARLWAVALAAVRRACR